MTRRPKQPTSSSSGDRAVPGDQQASSGLQARKPNSPPASRIAAMPSGGRRAAAGTGGTSPVDRDEQRGRGRCRAGRWPGPIGMPEQPDAERPAARPAGPGRPGPNGPGDHGVRRRSADRSAPSRHHSHGGARRRPAPIRTRPRPSRRCSGSRSRADVPTRRAGRRPRARAPSQVRGRAHRPAGPSGRAACGSRRAAGLAGAAARAPGRRGSCLAARAGIVVRVAMRPDGTRQPVRRPADARVSPSPRRGRLDASGGRADSPQPRRSRSRYAGGV